MSPFQPGAEKAPEPKAPAGLAGKVGHTARMRPPDPKGKGLAFALIAGAAVIAALYQFATGTGAAETVRENRAKDAIEAERRDTDLVAPRAPTEEPQPAPAKPSPPEPAVTPPAPAPGVPTPEAPVTTPAPEPIRVAPLPEGLGGETAANLRLALGAIQSGYTVAAADLPRLVYRAGERERPLVRQVVVETLARLAKRPDTRGLAFDAALALTDDNPGDLTVFVAAAAAAVSDGDDTAAEALVFLDHLTPADGAPAVGALEALIADDIRQLHLRVLAARVLAGWKSSLVKRRAVAAEASTPEVLKEALGLSD